MQEITKAPLEAGLQFITVQQVVPLTKGQQALLKLIQNKVTTKSALGWDDMVQCYYDNVRKIYHREIREWNGDKWVFKDYAEHDVIQVYKAQNAMWTYTLRSMVKSWFMNNIGVLVIKGKLIVIPTIELE